MQATVDEAAAEQFIEFQQTRCHTRCFAADLLRNAVSKLRERCRKRLRIALCVFLGKPLQSLPCASKRFCGVVFGCYQLIADLSQKTCERGLFDCGYVSIEVRGGRCRVHQSRNQFVRHVGAVVSCFRSDGQRIKAAVFLVLMTHRPENLLQRHGRKHIVGKLCRLREQRWVDQQRAEHAVFIEN